MTSIKGIIQNGQVILPRPTSFWSLTLGPLAAGLLAVGPALAGSEEPRRTGRPPRDGKTLHFAISALRRILGDFEWIL